MITLKRIFEVRKLINSWRKEGKTIGFVPTMGYLHKGHKSLIDIAKNNSSLLYIIYYSLILFFWFKIYHINYTF